MIKIIAMFVVFWIVLVMGACGCAQDSATSAIAGISQQGEALTTTTTEATTVDITLIPLVDAVRHAIDKAGAVEESVTCSPTDSGKSVILAYLKGKDNIKPEYIRRGMHSQARDIAKTLSHRNDFASITLVWTLPLVDAYGNGSERPVMRIVLNKETIDKINFDNFLLKNIPMIADDYFVHDVLSD